MNIYDFDGTIYRGDSTIDFYLFLLKRHPIIILNLPVAIIAAIKYKAGKLTITEFKEKFFSFLIRIEDVSQEVDIFWNKNINKIMPWYIKQKNESDIVISASPEFLLSKACTLLGIKTLIASNVEPKTGKFLSENCKGQEKVKRFKNEFKETIVDEFYSDSISDLPMAKLAKKSFLIKKGKIVNWNIN